MTMEGGGMSAMKPDLNDVDYDAFLANGRTLGDPEVVPVDKGGRVRLRLINGAASTNFTIDTGDLDASLIAVDGKGVTPVAGRRFPIAVAQRLDLLVALPPEGGAFPILALQEGTPARTGIVLASPGAAVARLASTGETGPVLDLRLESRLRPTQGLVERKADRRFVLKLAVGREWAFQHFAVHEADVSWGSILVGHAVHPICERLRLVPVDRCYSGPARMATSEPASAARTRLRTAADPPAMASSSRARLRNRCASHSSLKPIPPWIWMLDAALRSAARSATFRAEAARRTASLRLSAKATAANPTRSSAASARMAMSAHRCLTA